MQISKKELEKRISDSYEIPNNVIKHTPKPMVTIRTSTYQHGKYIKQCIEGVLSQKTDFPIEFIIGEDFSTDGTREIVMEYAKKYPNIIRVITADYNVGMKANGFRCIREMRGKYIALCEGDDYWTDPNKLQKQVDFLEKHKDYSFCFHQVKVTYENNEKDDFIFPDVDDISWYTHGELLKTNYIPTNSILYRNNKVLDFPDDIAPGDWYLHLYNAQFGKIKFMKKVMSVYRKHHGGVWWDYDANRDEIWKRYGIQHVNMQIELLKLHKGDKTKTTIIEDSIDRLLEIFIDVDAKHATKLLQEAFMKFPEQGVRFLQQKIDVINEKEAKIAEMWEVINGQKDIIEAKAKEIENIKSSKAWRILKASHLINTDKKSKV